MSSGSPILQYILTTLSGMWNHIINYPLTDLKFLIPVISMVAMSGVVRHMSVKQRIDSSPSLEKKREKFSLPRDRFNVEVDVILREDYSSYVRAMENDLFEIEFLRKKFMRTLRKYRRVDAMTRSTFERRVKRGKKLKKAVLNELIDAYTDIKKMSLSAITIETEGE